MANHKIEIRQRNPENILLAAEKIFSEKGYCRASMGDIAEQARCAQRHTGRGAAQGPGMSNMDYRQRRGA